MSIGNKTLPISCSLPAKHLRYGIFQIKTTRSVQERNSLIEAFEKDKDQSFEEVLRERVMLRIPKSQHDLVPYILQKLWLGPKLVYQEPLESQLKALIAGLAST